jgi:hypothetical protein
MPPLAEMQRDFALAILAGVAPAVALAPGRVSAAEAMRVHRNTVIGALVNALRLTYPGVDALVGEAFFDHAAATFAQAHPSASGRLAGYGEDFIAFLAKHVPSLPYLSDVARLDWAMERAATLPDTGRRFALDACVTLEWPVSLALLTLGYPADEIRAALGDDAALAAIDMSPHPRAILVWRKAGNVLTRAISAPATAFVEAMLANGGADTALSSALATSPDALQIIQSEVFSASFCTIGATQ